MLVFYFTATGNSLYVARRLGGTSASIPRLLAGGKREFADEAIGFVFPCHGFGVPRMVAEFLRQSRFAANYFFAVMTYGNRSAAGLAQFDELARAAGVVLDYTNEILMVDNYLPWFAVEAQLRKTPGKNIAENLANCVADIQARRCKPVRVGMAAKLFTRMAHPISEARHCDHGDDRFSVLAGCNNCGVCARVCPAGNIEVTDGPNFLHRCEGCFACLHHCPQRVLQVRGERSAARFLNEHVRLDEIIRANCRMAGEAQ